MIAAGKTVPFFSLVAATSLLCLGLAGGRQPTWDTYWQRIFALWRGRAFTVSCPMASMLVPYRLHDHELKTVPNTSGRLPQSDFRTDSRLRPGARNGGFKTITKTDRGLSGLPHPSFCEGGSTGAPAWDSLLSAEVNL